MLIDRSTLNYKCLHYLPSVGGKENHPLGGERIAAAVWIGPPVAQKIKREESGREWGPASTGLVKSAVQVGLVGPDAPHVSGVFGGSLQTCGAHLPFPPALYRRGKALCMT